MIVPECLDTIRAKSIRLCQVGTLVGYARLFMEDMTPVEHRALVFAIASKAGNAREISEQWGLPVPRLRKFVKDNERELTEVREAMEAKEREEESAYPDITPGELAELWISNKAERLRRYQAVADWLYKEVKANPTDATTLREFRSYLAAVANELGQLLHRGSGEVGMGDTTTYDIPGVDLNKLR